MEKELFIIWSIEHNAWWCMMANGYTKERRNAGTYTYQQAKNIVENANIGKHDIPNEAMIPYNYLTIK